MPLSSSSHSMRKRCDLPMAAACLFVAIIPAAALAATPKDDTTFTWNVKFVKGDVSHHKTTVHIDGQGGQGAMTIAVTTVTKREVTSVADNGDGTIVTTPESMDVNFNGNSLPDDPARHIPVTEVISSKGQVISIKVEGNNPFAASNAKLGQSTGLRVPPMPIKIGDSWKIEVPNPALAGKTYTMTYTLVSAESLYKIDTLKIKAHGTFPTDDAGSADKMTTLNIVVNVDRNTGGEVHMGAVFENYQLKFGPNPAAVKMTLTDDVVVKGVNDAELSPQRQLP